AQPAGRGRVGGDVHVLRAVAQRAEIVRLEEARAGVGGLRAVHAVEFRRVPDRLVHLEGDLVAVEHDGGDAAGPGTGTAGRRRLLRDAGSFVDEAQAFDVLPAGLAARADMRARVAALLE